MNSVTVIGGSIAGLSAALMLARAGHPVTVLERDPEPLPDTLAEAASWDRPTVPQTHHAHSMLALGRNVLARRLPDVLGDLLDMGAGDFPLADPTAHPDLVGLGTRRTTLEWVLRSRALAEPAITLRPGVVVTDLLWRRAGSVPQVVGVRTREHGSMCSTLVLDASGRRSHLPRWLRAAGVELAETSSDCELVAYSRFFRLRDGVQVPQMQRGNATVAVLDGFGCYAFLADARTIGIAVGRHPFDLHLAGLRHASFFDAVVGSLPPVAALVDPSHSEPISDVAAMGGLRNVLRDPLRAGSAQVHGLHAIRDALCTTNPAFGRGLSMALQHAAAVTDGVSAEPDRPDRQADLVARRLSRLTRPVWADTVAHDAERSYRWRQTVHAALGAVPAPRAVSMPTALQAAAADRRIGLRLLRAIHLLDSPSQFFDDEALAAAITGLDAPELPSVGSRAAALAAGHAVLTGRV